jgi:hypothetical protein
MPCQLPLDADEKRMTARLYPLTVKIRVSEATMGIEVGAVHHGQVVPIAFHHPLQWRFILCQRSDDYHVYHVAQHQISGVLLSCQDRPPTANGPFRKPLSCV